MTPTKRTRLDAELVRRGLVRSRSEARRSIETKQVIVGGVAEPRPATLVDRDDPISLTSSPAFVSRGGDKLDGAIAELGIEVSDKGWLDAGASTGGFTDRLLQGGASQVVAVDVGYGQFDWKLRNDPRVTLLERTNIRSLEPGSLPFEPEGVVADLSFISLRLVLPALVALASDDADHLLMVKPQFEVGKGAVGKGGVVRDPALWLRALRDVVDAAIGQGLGLAGAVASRLPGPAGNREFFLHFAKGQDRDLALLEAAVDEVAP